MSERRLQHNPAALRVVRSRSEGKAKYPWRCEHEDGRGRCTAIETRLFRETQGDTNVYVYLCERHEKPKCPHGCSGRMHFMQDAWWCPVCREEWSLLLFPLLVGSDDTL